MTSKRTAILGTGGWGTALAVLWASHGNEIILWGHTPERVEAIARTRQNPEYLPGTELPPNVRLTSQLADCATAELIVFVTPSVAMREVASLLLDQLEEPFRHPDELHERNRARDRNAYERDLGREVPC